MLRCSSGEAEAESRKLELTDKQESGTANAKSPWERYHGDRPTRSTGWVDYTNISLHLTPALLHNIRTLTFLTWSGFVLNRDTYCICFWPEMKEIM